MLLSRRFPKTANRFARDDHAATAVEFAIVAPLFIAMVVFIVDISVAFMVGANVDNSVWRAGDTIRNGTALSTNMTAAQFKTNVLCPMLPGFINCSGVKVNLTQHVAWSGNTWPTTGTVDYSSVAQNWCLAAPNFYQTLTVAVPMPTLTAIWAGSLSGTTQYYRTGTFFFTSAFTTSNTGTYC